MNNQDFGQLLARRLGLINTVLAGKAKEYASTEDRLHNFKAAALIQGCDPDEALLGMLTKHLVSVIDKITLLSVVPDQAWIDEKIGDCINYFILLEAIWSETNGT